MTDVDVLTTREDCLRARKILMDNGYISHPMKSVFLKPILADMGKHLPALTKGNFAIELHHGLFGPGKSILSNMVYQESTELQYRGFKFFIPQPGIFFLYLIRHLYYHELNNESQLRLYADLVVLIEKHRGEILNPELLENAITAGMEEVLAWRLAPLRDLWGISFPDWLNDFINKWYNPDSINLFVGFLKNPKDNPPINRARVYRNNLREVPGLHRKVLFLMGDLFPTISFMKKRYGCNAFIALFLYPLRIGKLFYLIRR